MTRAVVASAPDMIWAAAARAATGSVRRPLSRAWSSASASMLMALAASSRCSARSSWSAVRARSSRRASRASAYSPRAAASPAHSAVACAPYCKSPVPCRIARSAVRSCMAVSRWPRASATRARTSRNGTDDMPSGSVSSAWLASRSTSSQRPSRYRACSAPPRITGACTWASPSRLASAAPASPTRTASSQRRAVARFSVRLIRQRPTSASSPICLVMARACSSSPMPSVSWPSAARSQPRVFRACASSASAPTSRETAMACSA